MPLPMAQDRRRRDDFHASREVSLIRRRRRDVQLERLALLQLIAFWSVLILAIYLRAVL